MPNFKDEIIRQMTGFCLNALFDTNIAGRTNLTAYFVQKIHSIHS